MLGESWVVWKVALKIAWKALQLVDKTVDWREVKLDGKTVDGKVDWKVENLAVSLDMLMVVWLALELDYSLVVQMVDYLVESKVVM